MPNYKNMAPEGMITVQEAARRLWQEDITKSMPDSVSAVLRAACMRGELSCVKKPRGAFYIRRFVRYCDAKAYWYKHLGRKKASNTD